MTGDVKLAHIDALAAGLAGAKKTLPGSGVTIVFGAGREGYQQAILKKLNDSDGNNGWHIANPDRLDNRCFAHPSYKGGSQSQRRRQGSGMTGEMALRVEKEAAAKRDEEGAAAKRQKSSQSSMTAFLQRPTATVVD